MSKKQEGTEQSKRYKKMPLEENNDPHKRTESKPKAQEQNNKITNYFDLSTSTANMTKSLKAPPLDFEKKTIDELQEKIRERDKEIAQLRERVQNEAQRANSITFRQRQLKAATKPLIASTMLSLAEMARNERKRKDDKLGYFGQGMRTYHQGQKSKAIKKDIENKQALIKKLQEQSRSRKSTDEEGRMRIVSSLEYHQAELKELQKEQEHIEKEVAVYKDRLKLAQKEQKSYYCRLNWPIVYDRYQTLQLLGSGGFGQVYRCFDLEKHKIVALKRIYLSGMSNEGQREEFFKHVERQAQIQIKLDHPNIARFQNVIEIDKDKNLMVFQLEYCTGPELATYLRKHSCLQESKAKLIIRQCFSALDYLSKRKERIIHYDLKPSNIMFHEGVIKILDFGLSKIMHGEDTRMDLTSQGVGTYWYLPPETFDEYDPKISAKVDVWSLGVIFFELLYGRKPFGHGVPQSQIYNKGIILTAHKVVFPADTPRKHRVSEAAKQFIIACLRHDQDDRLSPSQAYNHSYFSK